MYIRISGGESQKKSSVQGFTLIELMVAIAIVAIMAAVGIVMYSTAQKSGRISKRVQDLGALKTALELYKGANGAYPIATTAGGFLCIGNSTGALAGLVPTYMPVLPADPLDGGNASGTNCYEYTSNASGSEYKIRTKAAIYGTSGEMTSLMFGQQPTLIDPARDGEGSCSIVPSPGPVTGWAVYSGSTACSY